jgi:hypothetical protein
MPYAPTKTLGLGRKELEFMLYLREHVFDPILTSPSASRSLKAGVRFTINRMEERNAAGMVQYFWSAIIGTPRSIGFAARMKNEGFTRFEEVLEEVRVRFNDKWLRS